MTFTVPESTSEEVASQLAWRIITGQLRPEERIQEVRMTKELDVSRSSIREALRILEKWHLIALIPHKGAVVMPLSAEQLVSLNDTWATLLSMLAIKVAEQWRDKDLEPIVAACEQLHNHVQENNLIGVVDDVYSVIKIGSSIINNQFIRHTMDNLRPAMIRGYYLIVSRYSHEPVYTHHVLDKIVQAIQQRKPEHIKNLVEEYVKHYTEVSLSALEMSAK